MCLEGITHRVVGLVWRDRALDIGGSEDRYH
jgi:hypothetical protein